VGEMSEKGVGGNRIREKLMECAFAEGVMGEGVGIKAAGCGK